MAARHQILVEGVNDQHVVRNLLKQHGIACELTDSEAIPGDFSLVIRDAKGYEKLLSSLRARLKEDLLARLAIVVDADSNVAARWDSLRNRLIELGATHLPSEPLRHGAITSIPLPDRTVQVGIWLMPDNSTPGGLEAFAAYLVPANDVLWPHARNVVDALPERRFHASAIGKARFATWLAWQKAPGMRLGEAISASLLDKNAAQAQELVAWIRRLFDLA